MWLIMLISMFDSKFNTITGQTPPSIVTPSAIQKFKMTNDLPPLETRSALLAQSSSHVAGDDQADDDNDDDEQFVTPPSSPVVGTFFALPDCPAPRVCQKETETSGYLLTDSSPVSAHPKLSDYNKVNKVSTSAGSASPTKSTAHHEVNNMSPTSGGEYHTPPIGHHVDSSLSHTGVGAHPVQLPGLNDDSLSHTGVGARPTHLMGHQEDSLSSSSGSELSFSPGDFTPKYKRHEGHFSFSNVGLYQRRRMKRRMLRLQSFEEVRLGIVYPEDDAIQEESQEPQDSTNDGKDNSEKDKSEKDNSEKDKSEKDKSEKDNSEKVSTFTTFYLPV
ncbi:hypothetical protein Btru_076903 [Bulinus truncatus]|nr:hypothetical protein Btru_076903 [Bulinus truncatus]